MMAGPRGTKVIQNGTPGHSDVKWGITEKIVTGVILGGLGWLMITVNALTTSVALLVRIQGDHIEDIEKHENLQQKSTREVAIAKEAAADAIMQHLVESHMRNVTEEDPN